jgi:DNA invertase Pin-like site-specific DNA recombinase
VSSERSAPRLRALIYNRVSSDPSGRRVSVESQDTENRAFCQRQDWEVVATIVDNDRSASRFAVKEREGYQQIRRALSGSVYGRIDVLVCWESSRAQRDLADYVHLRDLCTDHHVKFAYKGRVYDLTEGDDRFATGIDALVDEREAERTRERILRGHRTSVSQGKPRGVVPYGYKRLYDPVGGHLLNQVPDPDTAPVVKEIVRRIIGGDTLYGIAQDLNRRGVPTPRGRHDALAGVETTRPGWTSSMIRNLLRKQSLMGIRTYHGKVVGKATWEPIVTAKNWRKVQAILADPTRARNPRGVTPQHLLSGLCRCGVCGAWLRPMLNRGRMTYACAGVTPTSPKGHVVRNSSYLDAYVEETIVERLARRGGEETLVDDADEAAPADDIQVRIEELEARLAEFRSAAVRGGVSPESFAVIEGGINSELTVLRAQQKEKALVGLPPVVRDLLEADDVEDAWDELPLLEKRAAIRGMCTITVHRVGPGRGRPGFDPSTVTIVWNR